MDQNYVYILECSDTSYYCGWTNDIDKRFKTHQSGKASKYTRVRLPVKLVHLEIHPDKSAAMKREAAIKKLTRTQKQQLISSDLNQVTKP